MQQEEKTNKKKAKIEDFGGVHNAPSSFFNESIDDKMFSSKFIDMIKNIEEYSQNTSGVERLVNLKDDYEEQSTKKDKRRDAKRSVYSQFENLVEKVADMSVTQTMNMKSEFDGESCIEDQSFV